jgi:hypothetical protein
MKLTKPNQDLKLHVVFSSPFQKVVQIQTPIAPKKKNLLLPQCWCGGGHVNITLAKLNFNMNLTYIPNAHKESYARNKFVPSKVKVHNMGTIGNK